MQNGSFLFDPLLLNKQILENSTDAVEFQTETSGNDGLCFNGAIGLSVMKHGNNYINEWYV